jgi:acyl-CoA thioester hydrolase
MIGAMMRAPPATPDAAAAAPFEVTGQTVRPEWIDYNGHMNVAYYVLLFDKALDDIFDRLGIGAAYLKASNNSVFALECHIAYIRELKAGDPVRVTCQLLDADDKRVHYVMEMWHAAEGFRAAVYEQIALHVDFAKRGASPFPAAIQQHLRQVVERHRALPRPAEVGRVIGIRRKTTA